VSQDRSRLSITRSGHLRWHGRGRIAAAAASTAVLTTLILLTSLVGEALAHSLVPASNRGHTEGAILAGGIVTLISGMALRTDVDRRRRTHSKPLSAL
jgi:hypothetical protein